MLRVKRSLIRGATTNDKEIDRHPPPPKGLGRDGPISSLLLLADVPASTRRRASIWSPSRSQQTLPYLWNGVVYLILLIPWVAFLAAQENKSQDPYTSPENLAAGGRIFRSHCVACHGRDGTGGRGPDLTRGDLRYGSGAQQLADTISDGVPGTSMPFFLFEGKQLWQIVSFVQSLRQQSIEPEPKGDPAAGAVLFGDQFLCSECHMVNGRGGRQGPNLSAVGAKCSMDHLRISITQPNEWVSPLDWRLRVVTKDGRHISGVRLNEDTQSIQIFDSNYNLISLLKAEIQDYQIDRTSEMPSYEGRLSEGELDNLLAYLYTLRGKGTTR